MRVQEARQVYAIASQINIDTDMNGCQYMKNERKNRFFGIEIFPQNPTDRGDHIQYRWKEDGYVIVVIDSGDDALLRAQIGDLSRSQRANHCLTIFPLMSLETVGERWFDGTDPRGIGRMMTDETRRFRESFEDLPIDQIIQND